MLLCIRIINFIIPFFLCWTQIDGNLTKVVSRFVKKIKLTFNLFFFAKIVEKFKLICFPVSFFRRWLFPSGPRFIKLSLFLVFNVILVTVDIYSDTLVALNFFGNGHIHWGRSTLLVKSFESSLKQQILQKSEIVLSKNDLI